MMVKTNESDEEEKIMEVVKIVPYIWPLSPESLASGLFCKIWKIKINGEKWKELVVEAAITINIIFDPDQDYAETDQQGLKFLQKYQNCRKYNW